MNKPIRIQRKRTKGWKMPENTKCVDRSSNWGNLYAKGNQIPPYIFRQLSSEEMKMFPNYTIMDNAGAVYLFEKFQLPRMMTDLHLLRGYNLACFCKLDEPCHANLLLELANK